MESIGELRKICHMNYGKVKPPWRTRVARKVSIYLTWFFVQTPITPNQLTFLVMILGIITAFLFMLGNYYYSLLAIFLFHMSFFVDHSDGEVARYKKMSSIRGFYLDLMTHIVVNPLVIIGMAIGAYFHPSAGIPNYIFLAAGVLGAYSLTINNFIKLKKYEAYIILKEFKKLKEVNAGIEKKEDDKSRPFTNEIKNFFKISIFDAIFLFGILNLLSYLVLIFGVLYTLQAGKRFYSEYKNKL